MTETIKSTCGMCQMACGILIELENGKPVKIEGDPNSPVNRGKLCIKGRMVLQLLDNPKRLTHPLKRIGERGDGRWEKISWDVALESTAGYLMKAKEKYGPESVIFMRGGAKGLQEHYMSRFSQVFGTPNIASMAHNCYVPRTSSANITYGYVPRPDYEYPPACLIIWGMSPFDTRIGEYEQIVAALDKGTQLILVDPRRQKLTDRAALWLQIRPGSDLALALGMIHVIVNERLYDEKFVEKWTVGFEKLSVHVQDYDPEKVSKITWVPAELIRQAARTYALNKPACLQCGNAIDSGVNSVQAARASDILRVITGNLGIPGGELEWSDLPIHTGYSPALSLRDKVSEETRSRRLSASDNLWPKAMYTLPQRIVRAILKGDPYFLRGAYIQGGNLLLTYPNSKNVMKAFKKLDFIVATDLFMTPTTAMADIVLPVSSFLECDGLLTPPYYKIASVQQKVVQVGECRSDYEILKELAKRIGGGEYFWEEITGALDYMLKPANITFEEFRKIGTFQGKKLYRHYEKDGFNTPSGKAEIFSNQLKEWGFDPLPVYCEGPETIFSEPNLAKEYPLTIVSWKRVNYRHSSLREIDPLRRLHPDPTVRIHPETAAKLGIADGDWAFIETKRGRIKQKCVLSQDIDPRVVDVDFGWWFPEKGLSEMFDWDKSNINILTSDEPPFNREMGSPTFRGILCKVYRAEGE